MMKGWWRVGGNAINAQKQHRSPHTLSPHSCTATAAPLRTLPPDTLLYLLKKTRKAASRVQNWSTDLMVTFSFSMVVCSIAMLVK